MSPTAPTFGTLNDQLNKAYSRIRELEAREPELLARNRALCAVISELTHGDHTRTAAELTPVSNDGSGGFDIGDLLRETQAGASVVGRDRRHPRRTQRRQAHPDRTQTR